MTVPFTTRRSWCKILGCLLRHILSPTCLLFSTGVQFRSEGVGCNSSRPGGTHRASCAALDELDSCLGRCRIRPDVTVSFLGFCSSPTQLPLLQIFERDVDSGPRSEWTGGAVLSSAGLQCSRRLSPDALSEDVEDEWDGHHCQCNEAGKAVAPSQPERLIHPQSCERQERAYERPKHRVGGNGGGGMDCEGVDQVLLSAKSARRRKRDTIGLTLMQMSAPRMPMPNSKVPNNGIALQLSVDAQSAYLTPTHHCS